jgi:hypothetical protein
MLMKKIILTFLLALCLASPALAAGSSVPNLTASGAIVGSQLTYCPTTTPADFKCTFTQVATFINSLFSGDFTVASGGAATVTKTNGTAFGALATATPGTGVATAVAANLSASGGLTSTIASGTAALGTGAISSATCATVVTSTATNVATTDAIIATFNGDPTAVTGYVPLTTGMLTIIAYPTSGNVNFKVCNNTSASITPGAITLNWRVVR